MKKLSLSLALLLSFGAASIRAEEATAPVPVEEESATVTFSLKKSNVDEATWKAVQELCETTRKTVEDEEPTNELKFDSLLATVKKLQEFGVVEAEFTYDVDEDDATDALQPTD